MNESVDGSDRSLSLSISHYQLRLHYPSTPTLLYNCQQKTQSTRQMWKTHGFFPPPNRSHRPGAAEQSGAMATVAPKRASGRCSSLREIIINRCPDLKSPHPGEGLTPRWPPRKMGWWGRNKRNKDVWFKMVRYVWKKMEHMIGWLWSIDVFSAFCSPIYLYNCLTMSNLSLNNWRQVEQLFGCRSVRFQVSLCSYCFRSSYQHLITGQQFPKMLRSGISCHHQYVECKPGSRTIEFRTAILYALHLNFFSYCIIGAVKEP